MMTPDLGSSLPSLFRFAAPPSQPTADVSSGRAAPVPDVVVFSSAPSRMLSDLASAGLRQLAALVPAIEQAAEDGYAAPLAHFAKAANAAARQIAEGHAALLAEGPDRIMAALPGRSVLATSPSSDAGQLLRILARQIGAEEGSKPSPRANDLLRDAARLLGDAADHLAPHAPLDSGTSPADRWVAEAKHLLRGAGDALDRAEETLRPPTATTPVAPIPMTPALLEIAAAQSQLATTYATLARARLGSSCLIPRTGPAAFTPHLEGLRSPVALTGILLVLMVLWLAGALWSLVTGMAVSAFWTWRFGRAARGVTLDVAR